MGSAAHAQGDTRKVDFDIPAGTVSAAITSLGTQAHITIGGSDPMLASVRTKGVRGRLSIDAALTRMLAHTGFTFVRVSGIVRIVRAAVPVPRARPKPRPVESAVAPPRDIIVTGSKQSTALNRFAGTVRFIDLDETAESRRGSRGTEFILNRLPMLASTNLGPGRNRLYIRGIADSSFNGPTQSIVGQYLGDVRLTFNAPDPDLQLYDMAGVEVLEGPQGTLYGSGSLGGILRLIPNMPDTHSFLGSASLGGLVTQHGGVGGDGAAMLNLPIAADRLALRVVGYGSTSPGYIDDIGRGRNDVNRTTIYGARAGLRWNVGDDWTVDFGGLFQIIRGRDGQYAMAGLSELTRRSSLTQPFNNDFKLGQLVVRKTRGEIELMSATGAVEHDVESVFDATDPDVSPDLRIFRERTEVRMISNETRLSRAGPNGAGWVAGLSFVHDTDRLSRRLGPVSAPAAIPGVRNETTEAAIFGHFGYAVTDNLVASAGGRVTFADTTGLALDTLREREEPQRRLLRLTPAAGIAWRLSPATTLFARYQEGFRAGGLGLPATGSDSTARRFESDKLTSVEAGLRVGNQKVDRLSFDATASFTWWRDIQADLLDAAGLPFTVNVGDGRIIGFEASGVWRPVPAMTLDLSIFVNKASITSPRPELGTFDIHRLPNIAPLGGRMAVKYLVPLSSSARLELEGSARYFGESETGIGTPLDLEQGEYLDTDLGARIDLGRIGFTLDLTNIADTQGNRFSYGNPFSLGNRLQTTPLRPRTLRLGFDARF